MQINKDKLNKIFNHYGKEKQFEKLQEEVDELYCAMECSETLEYENDPMEILEEMADVYVMLSQFIIQEDIGERIIKIANEKVDRQIERIEEEVVNG